MWDEPPCFLADPAHRRLTFRLRSPGFDCTSNVLAGRQFGIPVAGTVAHSYVASFSNTDEVRHLVRTSETPPPGRSAGHPIDMLFVFSHQALQPASGQGGGTDFLARAQSWLQEVCRLLQIPPQGANPGELAAFVSYAGAFPLHFLVVVDTYSVMM